MTVPHLQLSVVLLCVAQPARPRSSSLSVTSLLDLPVMRPLVDAGAGQCESLKNLLGVSYDQVQANATKYDDLSIDHVTATEVFKYNLTRGVTRLLDSGSIVVLIHGFLETSDGGMVQGIASELVRLQQSKVFALDGRKLNTIDYFKSTTHALLIGQRLGDALSLAIERGQDPNNITLVGHSLGAHVAGVAGRRVVGRTGRRLGRVTGLDPAGPCFSADPTVRLNRSDAAFVDVIHTNAGLLGIGFAIGHKDFFPNGGRAQPGCYLSTCDHSRAWELYAEAVRSPKSFPARRCSGWQAFTEGRCVAQPVAYLRGAAAGGPGLYFLSTRPAPPYALGAAGAG